VGRLLIVYFAYWHETDMARSIDDVRCLGWKGSAKIRDTRSGAAKANGPGASGSEAGGGGKCADAALSGKMSSGFSSSARQQTKASRPLGLRLRRMLKNAAVGSAKNITPNREKAASNEAVLCERAAVLLHAEKIA
jgi:hypothetical protein